MLSTTVLAIIIEIRIFSVRDLVGDVDGSSTVVNG